MRIERAPLALLLLLACALEARGATEICRFPALDADNPFRRWLQSQEVTCVAAGSPIEFPSGLWNVFARGEGTVTAVPLLIDGDREPATIVPALAPAATIAPLLPEGRGGVIYVPRRGSALPVDGPRVRVPADEPLWLFVLDKTTPVALIPIAPLAEGTERPVDARSGGPPAIVGWLQVPQADRTALETATAVTSPLVRAGSREADPLPSPLLLHGAFVRIAEVGGSSAELRLEGRGWIPDRRVVKVQPGVTVAPAPLLVRGTGTLIVHWNSDQDLAALDGSLGSCEDSNDPPQLVIAVSKCAAPRPSRGADFGECTLVREEKGGGSFGSIAFDELVPGLYRAEMRYGELPPSMNAGNVGPLRVLDLRISGAYFTAYGSLTRGGEPLGERTRLTFPGGTGFAPEDSEEYRAVFRPDGIGRDTQITVEACDGSPRAIVLAEEPMRPRSRFNIDIPANELALHINDTFTREPLPGATVKLEAMSKLRPPRVVLTTRATSGEDGNVLWSSVPVREIHLSVSLAGYEPRRVDPFTMPASGRQEIDVQLVPLRGTRGKIVSERPFEGGWVVWFSPTGSETERTELAADGTFVYTNWHTPDETMAVVSASHPLWVLHAPATERRQSISLRFPAAPPVDFDLWLAESVRPGVTRYTTVAIGGVRVPQPVFAQHQNLRREQPLLRQAGPHRVRDLLATGPIDVLLGPPEDDVTSRTRGLDIFAFDRFAEVPRQRLEPGATDVVFVSTPPARSGDPK